MTRGIRGEGGESCFDRRINFVIIIVFEVVGSLSDFVILVFDKNTKF